jgi:dipeptidyl aminopeptidase/acylaminoacyl peptidase
VRPEQSADLERRLRADGRWVERCVYEGEGHGWRRVDTIVDEYRRIDAFLARWVP